jgi:hypothetical protein
MAWWLNFLRRLTKGRGGSQTTPSIDWLGDEVEHDDDEVEVTSSGGGNTKFDTWLMSVINGIQIILFVAPLLRVSARLV